LVGPFCADWLHGPAGDWDGRAASDMELEFVASAFHPALAPVGVLLAVGGYVLGTYAGMRR